MKLEFQGDRCLNAKYLIQSVEYGFKGMWWGEAFGVILCEPPGTAGTQKSLGMKWHYLDTDWRRTHREARNDCQKHFDEHPELAKP